MDSVRVGAHTVRCVESGLVYLTFVGDINGAEGRRISEIQSDCLDGGDGKLLIDLRELGKITPEARKELSAQRVPPKTDRNYRVDLVFIGANIRTKVLMTVVVAAASIASNVKVASHYVGSIDEAIAWTGVPAERFG